MAHWLGGEAFGRAKAMTTIEGNRIEGAMTSRSAGARGTSLALVSCLWPSVGRRAISMNCDEFCCGWLGFVASAALVSAWSAEPG